VTIVEDMRSVEPFEDSLGFCPDFDNSAIYFTWAKR